MNLTTASALLPTLENLFGQVYGWTLPRTTFHPKSVSFCQFDPNTDIIEMGVFKCTPAVLSFIWFHEAYHFVQFSIDKIDDTRYYEAVKAFDTDESDMYYWIKEEREANMAAFEMCKKMGLTDFIPEWIPAGYFE